MMVATDIAARGIDVEGISHVINFNVPNYAEDYIHRIGRTGRAEATGIALTFVSFDEAEYLRKIERFIGRQFNLEQHPDFPCNFFTPKKPEVQGLRRNISGMGRGRRFGGRRH